MRHIIDVPDYDPARGVRTEWDEGARVAVAMRHGELVIEANVAGLRSLARHCLVLSQNATPTGHHIHMDDWNGLSPGSVRPTIQRV